MGRRANVLMLDGENRIVTALEPAPGLVGTVIVRRLAKIFSDSGSGVAHVGIDGRRTAVSRVLRYRTAVSSAGGRVGSSTLEAGEAERFEKTN